MDCRRCCRIVADFVAEVFGKFVGGGEPAVEAAPEGAACRKGQCLARIYADWKSGEVGAGCRVVVLPELVPMSLPELLPFLPGIWFLSWRGAARA